MSTGIANKSQSSTAIAKPIPARIPYPVALGKLFGIDSPTWKVLCEATFPEATSPDSIALALSYCKSRNLDVMKKPVHIVPVWNSKLKRVVETIWPSIGELRITAARTGEYAGREDTVFGPTIEMKIGTADMKFPEWAQVTVLRMVKGVPCRFTGPKVFWLEAYAQLKRDDATPNSMWQDRPFGQCDKCAEAASLRVAFPEEIGNDYIPEEASGRNSGAVLDAEPTKRTTLADLTSQYAEEPADPNPALDSFDDEQHDREPGDEPTNDAIDADFEPADDHFLATIQTEFDACETVAAVGLCHSKWFGQATENEQRKAISAMAISAKKRVAPAK